MRREADGTRETARVAVVAGEASGDLLGGLLIQSLRNNGLNADFYGIAGAKMQAAGARSLFDMAALSVRGYVEALGSLRKILRIRAALRDGLLKHPPRLFIGIDAPDFNLKLEARLKRAGIPTVHFVSPSVWAWRPKRIRAVKRAVDHTLLIFPFEEAIYREAGIPATYVGHPLAHALPAANPRLARERLGIAQDAPAADSAADARDEAGAPRWIALLPGSRVSEIKALAPLFIETAKALHARHPDARFLVPLVNRETRLFFEEALYKAQAGEVQANELPLRILFGHAHDALQAADCALIASGTATLEALLLDCPHVITYKVPWLTYRLMKRQALQAWVGLPNILAGRLVAPELLQDQATPQALAAALGALLDDPEARRRQREEFAIQRARLTRDTPRLIAQALRPFLEG